MAFAFNMFEYERTKKFRKNYDHDDHKDQMRNSFQNRTEFLMDVAHQATWHGEARSPLRKKMKSIGKSIFQFKIQPLDGTVLKVSLSVLVCAGSGF